MQNLPMSSEFNFLTTKSQVNAFKDGVREVLAQMYKTQDQKVNIKNYFDEENAKLVQSLVDLEGSPDKIDKSLRALLKKVDTLEEVKVILSFQPKLSFIEKLAYSLKSKLGKDIILDISVDPAILGGIMIISQGKIIDLSLKSKLEKYFANYGKH